MKLPRRFGRTVYAGGILACALACMPAIVVHAEERVESGVVQIIVPFGTGGGADSLGRETARLLAGVLSAPIDVSDEPTTHSAPVEAPLYLLSKVY